MISGIRLAPSSLRHLVWADIISLNAIARPVFAAKTAFGLAGAMSDRCEGTFDWIGGSDVLPVLGRKAVESQEDIAIFGQFSDSLVVFHALGVWYFLQSGSDP